MLSSLLLLIVAVSGSCKREKDKDPEPQKKTIKLVRPDMAGVLDSLSVTIAGVGNAYHHSAYIGRYVGCNDSPMACEANCRLDYEVELGTYNVEIKYKESDQWITKTEQVKLEKSSPCGLVRF